MLAATSAAISAARVERELLEGRIHILKEQPRLGYRLRVAQHKLAAVVARLAELEEAARAEEAGLAEDDEVEATLPIVVGLVLAADRSEATEVGQVRKQLRAMLEPELLASVEATRAARNTLAGVGTVVGICARNDHDTALALATQVAAERGIGIPPVMAVVKAPSRNRGGKER
jgi:hypothetical protein